MDDETVHRSGRDDLEVRWGAAGCFGLGTYTLLMRMRLVLVGVLGGLLGSAAGQEPLVVEHGVFTVNLLLHAVGTEEYSVRQSGGGGLVMVVNSAINDRGMKRASATTYAMGRRYEPGKLEMTPAPGVLTLPVSVQMMVMRYWMGHGRPTRLPVFEGGGALPLEIREVGHEAFQAGGRIVRLTRYTVANLVWGREVLWMNDSRRVVAVMTFAGGLPVETVLDEYGAVGPQLVESGVRQEMLDLAELGRAVPVEASGSYAIVGGRLIDGTGRAPVEGATVIVRGGRIAAAGAGAGVAVPAGMRVVHAEGRSVLPGLWEMHVHYSGVEFGPALLAAGVTTARDCGGEFGFLMAVRKAIDQEHALGPRLVLAGLIDSGGPLAFGAVDVETPAEGVAAVDLYADAKFQQIKVYTQIKAEVLRAIAAEAHRRGMTVTGHVPAAVTTAEGIADGMDMINHLQYVSRAMTVDGKVDVGSAGAREMIALLKAKGIVVDPTEGWGEMAGHPKSVDAGTFEPGVAAAPYVLAARFRGMGGPAEGEARWRERMAGSRGVVRALHEAGVTIVPGTDTGLVGYGLDRELELYVEAGFTPMEAIEAATRVSAKAMGLDGEVGTVEVGKRADLVIVEGNPAVRIGDLRRVMSVVTEGRMYGSKALGASVGFRR